MTPPYHASRMWDAAAFNVVSFAAALTWALSLRVRPLRLAPLTVLLLHVMVIQAWVLLTGLAGELNITAWRWTAGGLALLLAIAWIMRRRILSAELAMWRDRTLRTLRRIGWPIATLSSLVILAFIAWLAVWGFLVGPFIPDVLHYHLTPSAIWTAAGQIEAHAWNDARSWWPQGHGLLAIWWMLPPRAFHAAPLAELHWVALTFAVVWALARNLGSNARVAAVAVMLVVTVPVVWAQGTSGLNDLAVSVLMLASLAVLSMRRADWRHLMLAATAILLGLAIKPTMMLLAAPVVVLGLVRWWRAPRRGPRSMRRVALVTLTPLIAFALAAFWYGTATVHKQNPLYPAALRVMGRDIRPGSPDVEGQVGHINLQQLGSNLFDLVWHKAWDRTRLRDGLTEHGSGFGGPAVALGLPALLALFIWRRRNRALVVTLLVSSLLLCAGLYVDVWNGRFFSFVPIAMIAAIPLTIRLLRSHLARGVWLVLLLTSAAWSVVEGARAAVPPLARTWFESRGLERVPQELLLYNRHVFMLQSVQEVPPGATLIVVNLHKTGPVAPMVGEDLSRRILFHDGVPDPYQTLAWKEAGLRWVLAVVSLDELREADLAMEQIGLFAVAPGLYVIP